MRALLYSMSMLGACYKAPPPAPIPPTPPAGLARWEKTIDLPAPLMAEGFHVFAVPKTLPLPTSETVVLALPTPGGGKESGALRPEANALRVGLISAFLDAGYRVKDAGEITIPRMQIRSNPEYTGKSTPIPPPPLEFGATLPSGGRDEAWGGIEVEDGLQLVLSDPTSLWAPELTEYPDLGARFFFRVFEIEVSEQLRGTGGRRYYSEAQVEAFEARASGVNAEMSDWMRRRESLVASEIRYLEAHAEFRTACRAWEERYAAAIRARGIQSGCSGRPEEVQIPEAPRPISRDTLQAYLSASGGVSTPRIVGRVVAELVDTRSGEVVWVGRAEVEVDPGPDAHARVFSLMLQKLRGF